MASILSRIEATGPKRALALSGGGTMGVIEIAFLEKIEAVLRDHFGKPDLKLCDYFDLIGGTSTGAIIATALSLGMTAEEVKKRYFDMGPKIFKHPWLNVPLLHPRFDAANLAEVLNDILGDRELQTEDLKTVLAIITKRVDTGSPWVITNNPRQKWWDHHRTKGRQADTLGNRHYKLKEIVRASTAAPFFFAPQRMEIFRREEGDKLEGLFVDGGISPYNNPAWQLFMLGGIHAYGFNWLLGEENLLIISIGTGWCRPRILVEDGESLPAAELAVQALRSLIWDGQMNALASLQWMSKPRLSWEINSEIGSLETEFLTKCLGGQRNLLSFQHYDVKLDPPWVKEVIGEAMTEEALAVFNDVMNPAIMQDAYALAHKVAEKQVLIGDFPPAFDLKASTEAETVS